MVDKTLDDHTLAGRELDDCENPPTPRSQHTPPKHSPPTFPPLELLQHNALLIPKGQYQDAFRTTIHATGLPRSSITNRRSWTDIPLLTIIIHLPNAVGADLRLPKARPSAQRRRPLIQFHIIRHHSLIERVHLPDKHTAKPPPHPLEFTHRCYIRPTRKHHHKPYRIFNQASSHPARSVGHQQHFRVKAIQWSPRSRDVGFLQGMGAQPKPTTPVVMICLWTMMRHLGLRRQC